MREVGSWLRTSWRGIELASTADWVRGILLAMPPTGASAWFSSLVVQWQVAAGIALAVFVGSGLALVGYLSRRDRERQLTEELRRIFITTADPAGETLYGAIRSFHDKARLQGPKLNLVAHLLLEWPALAVENARTALDEIFRGPARNPGLLILQERFSDLLRAYRQSMYYLRDAHLATERKYIDETQLVILREHDARLAEILRDLRGRSEFDFLAQELENMGVKQGKSYAEIIGL